jgi:hypothetical protein
MNGASVDLSDVLFIFKRGSARSRRRTHDGVTLRTSK